MKNETILKQKQQEYNKIKGARVGDYLYYKNKYVRFSHEHSDSLQTSLSGSFYLGSGYISFSGSLNHGVNKNLLIDTKRTKKGSIWFFDEGLAGGGRGKYFNIDFRVFKLKSTKNIKDYDILGYDIKEEQLKKTKETITRINGNGKPYISHIPKIVILERDLNDMVLKRIFENTKLKFKKGWTYYTAQPQTSNQVLTLIMTYDFKTKYCDNATEHNTIYLKFCSDSDFKN